MKELEFNLVKTSYSEDDITVLLKDLTGQMEELSIAEREQLIQSGVHYSQMLPKEEAPSEEYEKLFNLAVENNKYKVASSIIRLGDKIISSLGGIDLSNGPLILVSLARAGNPVGILLKRYYKLKYDMNCPHYSISIIRDVGIDTNAMDYIYNREILKFGNKLEHIVFIDGWTGKGVIKNQLSEAVAELKSLNSKWDKLKDRLCVLSDPADVADVCGTHEDFLLPNSCLNSTISGLTSRTIFNALINISGGDFHGAVYFERFKDIDYSNKYIDLIESVVADSLLYMNFGGVSIASVVLDKPNNNVYDTGMEVVNKICADFDVADYKKVKPGIGETTRVLLRRIPWKILINTSVSMDDADIQHILELAKEKEVIVERYPLGHYKVCGIIKDLSADL